MSTPGSTALSLRTAGRLHQRAVAENLAGHPARGARLVQQALSKLGAVAVDEPTTESEPDRAVLIARLLATLAKSEVEMLGLDSGLAGMARAAQWATRAGPDVKAFLHGQRGLILFRGGRFSEAQQEFDRALQLTPAAGIDRCRVLLNRGALFVEMGAVESARSDLTLCIDLARSLGLSVFVRIALHNLGCLEFIAGDLPLALRTMDEGMRLDGDTQQGIAHLDRARVLLAAGLQHEADDALALASELLSRDRCWQDVGEVELTRAASALLGGDASTARRLAARARDRFRRHGNDRWRRNAELTLLQADLRDGRPLSRLVPHAHRLVDEFAADGFSLQARTAELLAAELEQGLGRVAYAAELAASGGQQQPHDPIALRLQARYVQARLRLAQHDKTAAKRNLRAGMAELAAYQSQFGGIDLQTASAVHGRRLAELDLEVALAEGRPAGVLAAVERSRAASRRLRLVTPPADETVAALLSELRLAVQNLRARLTEATGSAQLAADRRRIADLQRELRARSWQTEGSGERTRPATTSELRAAFSGGEQMLVSFVESPRGLHAVTIHGQRARLIHLGPAQAVNELVTRMHADLDVVAQEGIPARIMTAAAASLSHALGRLDAMLIAPLGHRASGEPPGRLVIIPTGGLLTLPWTMLPSLRFIPVEVAPSATAWMHATPAGPVPGQVAVSLLAGPGLPRAEDEVTAIAQVWPEATVLTGAAAGPGTLRTALAGADVVHVAAHGEHQSESPMFSSLQLDGGPVFAYELDRTARAAGHVILSACDVGLTTIRAGEESLGLTSALLHLGTRCVVAGVARVNDETAGTVMVDYHRRLARGVDSASALAQACAGSGPRPAPFVSFGAAWSAVPAG